MFDHYKVAAPEFLCRRDLNGVDMVTRYYGQAHFGGHFVEGGCEGVDGRFFE